VRGKGRRVAAPLQTQVHGAHVDVNLQLLTPGRAGIPRPDLVTARICSSMGAVSPSFSCARPRGRATCLAHCMRRRSAQRATRGAPGQRTWLEKSFLLDLPPIPWHVRVLCQHQGPVSAQLPLKPALARCDAAMLKFVGKKNKTKQTGRTPFGRPIAGRTDWKSTGTSAGRIGEAPACRKESTGIVQLAPPHELQPPTGSRPARARAGQLPRLQTLHGRARGRGVQRWERGKHRIRQHGMRQV